MQGYLPEATLCCPMKGVCARVLQGSFTRGIVPLLYSSLKVDLIDLGYVSVLFYWNTVHTYIYTDFEKQCKLNPKNKPESDTSHLLATEKCLSAFLSS